MFRSGLIAEKTFKRRVRRENAEFTENPFTSESEIAGDLRERMLAIIASGNTSSLVNASVMPLATEVLCQKCHGGFGRDE
jgi:hypothetical protein